MGDFTSRTIKQNKQKNTNFSDSKVLSSVHFIITGEYMGRGCPQGEFKVIFWSDLCEEQGESCLYLVRSAKEVNTGECQGQRGWVLPAKFEVII